MKYTVLFAACAATFSAFLFNGFEYPWFMLLGIPFGAFGGYLDHRAGIRKNERIMFGR